MKVGTRTAVLRREIALFDADVLLLQEIEDFKGFWEPRLKAMGYNGLYKKRTEVSADKKDGCAIFWKFSRLRCNSFRFFEHNELATVDDLHVESKGHLAGLDSDQAQTQQLLHDNVGIVAHLQQTAESGIDEPAGFVVATTHIFWDPLFVKVKNAQVENLLRNIAIFMADHHFDTTQTPLVIGGDFNSMPGSLAHTLLLNRAVAFGLPTLQSVFAALGLEEPKFTNITPDFTATIDYLVISPGIRVTRVLGMPARAVIVGEGLPDSSHPSDHLPLIAEILLP